MEATRVIGTFPISTIACRCSYKLRYSLRTRYDPKKINDQQNQHDRAQDMIMIFNASERETSLIEYRWDTFGVI
jgi:hypothetical protein